MNALRLLYCRTHHWSTPFLRFAAWSPWAHVAVVEDSRPDSIIDATFRAGGVSRRSLSGVLQTCSRYEFRTFYVPDLRAGMDFAQQQIGKPYDTWGVIGLGLHRDWQTEDAWWCSEFAEAVLAAAGLHRFRPDAHRLTQQHSWMVL